MLDDEALVTVGVVARPHGVKGELRVHRLNPESGVLLEVAEVMLVEAGAARRVKVEGTRMGPKGAVLMRLEGVVGRDAADAIRGAELAVPRATLPETEDDEWYFVDLIGLRAEDEEGTTLGDVVDVIEYPTIICLVVRHTPREVREVPLATPYLVDVELDVGRVLLSAIDDLPERKATKHERLWARG